jgi:hypothetical protein
MTDDITGLYRTEEPIMVRSAPSSPKRHLPTNDNKRSSPERSSRKISSFTSPESKLISLESEEFLDEELKRYGYTISNKMIILDDGNASTQYIVAKSPRGNQVVVDLDTQGYVSVDKDPNMYMSSMSTHDDKIEDHIVDLCENGLCIRNPDGKMLNLYSAEFQDVGSSKASYPLVNMSSIRLSPEGISSIIQDKTDKIVSSCIECGLSANDELTDRSYSLNSTITMYRELYSKLIMDSTSIISQLEGYKNIYSTMNNLPEGEYAKYQTVLKILEEEKSKVNNITFKYNEVLNYSSQLKLMEDKVKKIMVNIESM